MKYFFHPLQKSLLTITLLLLSACAVGPDFRRPPPPVETAYGDAPLPAATVAAEVPGGAAQRFNPAGKIPLQWWTLFRSEPLERLIRDALTHSPDLAAAQAALRQAAELRRAEIGGFFPSLDAGLSVQRQKFTGASFGQPGAPGTIFTLYNASVSVSYGLDPFGLVRRRVEASQAQQDYERFLLEGARLTLAANLVTLAAREASVRARLDATNAIVAAEEELLHLVRRRVELGAGTRPDLLAQEAQLAQVRTSLPPLEKELAQTRHQLAVLAGLSPAQAGTLPVFQLDCLELPLELPVSLPSELVRQRPDIRAGEELLHQASADVGVATANLFPRLTLTGDFGSQTSAASELFAAGTGIWSIGVGLVQPLFRGGELLARRRAAVAAYEEADALYRKTVLQAFQNVADVLKALELDAKALKAQAEAEAAARSSFEVTQTQYRLGAVNYLSLLVAQRQHQQALVALADAKAARFADTAALFQALGGGWWNKEHEPASRDAATDVANEEVVAVQGQK